MAIKIPNDKFFRVRRIEKMYKIEDMKIYAYIDGEIIRILGEIYSDGIYRDFKLSCTIYDDEGDMIYSSLNESYGTEFATSKIKKESFFDGYPFAFNINIQKDVKIGGIRIIPI